MPIPKHTAAPWRLREVIGQRQGAICEFLAVYGPGEYDIVFPKVGTVVDADARLIAAAPDLLDALKCLMGTDPKHAGMKYGDRVRLVEAAISRAEGK